MTIRDTLESDPSRFAFDAAIRVLLYRAHSSDPARVARFASPTNLAYPGCEIQAVGPQAARTKVLTTVMGMTGPSGVLPRGYTELVSAATRDRSPSLHAFLDMLADRFVAGFARAGSKYRVHRSAEDAALDDQEDPVGRVLLALTGYANGDLGARLGPSEAALQHYAGFFATRPRSADRLAALACDWLGRPVHVRQFAGAWLALPLSERSALPGRGLDSGFAQLGIDAVAGVRAWDLQARVLLVVGPLDRAAFEALLPGGGALERFVAVIRAFLGFETAFAINLVLRRDAVPALRLDAASTPAPRLGWNSWLTAPANARLTDPSEPIFEAERVELGGANGGGPGASAPGRTSPT